MGGNANHTEISRAWNCSMHICNSTFTKCKCSRLP